MRAASLKFASHQGRVVEKADGPEARCLGGFPEIAWRGIAAITEVAMKAITKAMINKYWHKRYDELIANFIAVALVFIGISTITLAGRFKNGPATASGWVIVVVGIIIALLFTRLLAAPKREEDETPEEKLLERWHRYSGRPLKEFPTSELECRLDEVWAKLNLVGLANNLNGAYQRQEEFSASANDFFARHSSLPQRAIDAVLKEQADVNKLVVDTKAEYLNFWDLVAQGREVNRVRILNGPEWSDPEVFRKKVLDGETDF